MRAGEIKRTVSRMGRHLRAMNGEVEREKIEREGRNDCSRGWLR
jgi:hypothetical protein